MRLTEYEIEQIKKTFSHFLEDQKAELYLFGSRVDDDLKGGDIDLLLLMENHKKAEAFVEKKHFILAKLKDLIGDQRIDLKITDKSTLKKEPFLQIIFPKVILLHQW